MRPGNNAQAVRDLTGIDAGRQHVPPDFSRDAGRRRAWEVSFWRLNPRSDSAPRFGAGIPHMLHQETLWATLVVVARGYNANCARAVLT